MLFVLGEVAEELAHDAGLALAVGPTPWSHVLLKDLTIGDPHELFEVS